MLNWRRWRRSSLRDRLSGDDWVATHKLILTPAVDKTPRNIRVRTARRSCVINEILRPFFQIAYD
jgi:hypothetical protein